jgi:hypothetical protein
MSSKEMDHLTASGRVTHKHDILQVEVFKEYEQVFGVSVHVIAVPWLT